MQPPVCFLGYKSQSTCRLLHDVVGPESQQQTCLRWAVQKAGIVASGTGKDPSMALQYSRENLAIFDFTLSDAEMAALDAYQYQYQDSHSTLDIDAVIYR